MKKYLCLIFLCAFLATAKADLIHRYSFSGDANDSIGTAHGVLVNNDGDASYDGTSLEMGNSETPGSNSGEINYVDLPNGTISALSPGATFEAWVTWSGPSGSSWQRIFDFGTSNAGEDQSVSSMNATYFFMTPYSSAGTARFGYRLGETATEYMIDTGPLPTDVETHVAITWDDVTGQVTMYVDGQQAASGPLHYTLSQMDDLNNWLGRSQWPDPGFNGIYNEFRIYDLPLTADMINASYQAGPDSPVSTYAVPSNPSPQDDGISNSLTPTLGWQSDGSADIISHRVYLGTNANTVLKATTASAGIYQGAVPAGTESFPISSSLEMDQTYYWRIEEVTSSGYTFSSPVWSFQTVNLMASNPSPASGTEGVSATNLTLQWQSGADAIGHRILFGTNPSALSVLESNYPATSYELGSLDFGTNYYWRVDELFASAPTMQGDVWSFRTMKKPQPCLPGDLDGDCKVDLPDLVLFCQAWMTAADCSAFDCPDFDQSQFVDIADLAVISANWQQFSDPMIVINEIHYHADNNKEPVEFIELYHAGAQPIDLDGWYLSTGVRYTFQGSTVMNPGDFVVICRDTAAFQAKYGMTAYGPFEGKLSNNGERLVLRDATGNKIDEVDYNNEFPWPIAADGEGASMELINPYLDNDLAGSWRCSGYQDAIRPELAFGPPSPGMPNGIYSEDAAPQIRKVDHTPNQPLSTEAIIITAKITDPEGVGPVTMKYQINEAGAYIPAYLPISVSSLVNDPYQEQPINPDFEDAANWSQMTMVDDGSGADEQAGDSVYTAVLPAQNNRTLIRYRIEAQDTAANAIRVPYQDDPSLNFACYVYDGVPAYVASKDSVSPGGAGHVYNAEIMNSIPVYTLIADADDMYMCNGYNSADQFQQNTFDFNYQEAARRYNWSGTFVYDGKVYDNMKYRLRGGNGRYNNGNAGKRSMKFRFNRGNYFQARDIEGKKFDSKWKNLNTGKMFGNHTGYPRYAYGVNEVVNYHLFAQANVPAPAAWWFHFRIIDGADEAPNTTDGQYEGDFYGIHIAFENYDSRFLERWGLPKGNLYKLSDKVNNGLEQLRYQAPDGVDDASDYENIRWNLNHEASADFIRNHMDCDEWYRYHTVSEAIRHYDVFSGGDCWHCLKNMAWYFLPEYTAENNYLGKLWFLPFDFDDTWGPYWNAAVDHGKAAIYDQRYLGGLETFTQQPEKSPLKQEYRNYIREFRDLHWQPDVINNMIDEMAAIVEDIVPADRDRWRQDYTVPGNPMDFGPLDEGIAIMKDFAWTAGSYGGFSWPGAANNLDSLANDEGDDTNIPNTPVVSYIGTAGYPENDLQFQVSNFSDPQGDGTFAAMKWRIAEYAISTPSEPDPITTAVLLDQNQVWRYFKGTEEPTTPIDLWRQNGYNDDEWLSGQTSIGYGDGDDNTTLGDMQNNYSTVYLRNTFEVLDKDNVQALKLHVYIDDGCVIWINGTEVARLYCNGDEKYYDSFTASAHHEASSYEEVVLTGPYNYLVDGDNVIAVHGLQETLGSSDFSVDVKITADLVDPLPPAPTVNKSKYEIDPVWESEELTTFASDMLFPADGVTAGKTYRVRCKMKDTTGRWSHWSAPVEFVAGEAIGADIRNYLRMTELMYNNGDADFIELKNISDTITLDLSDVSFTNGVEFAFGNPVVSSITTLAPEDFVLVIRDQAAFETQYGTSHNSKIAGVFDGKLSNSGETLKLEDYWNGTLLEFEYGTGRTWPIAADGSGHSLVPRDEAIEDQVFGTLDYGANWRHSTYIGGSPGADDPTPPVGVVINELMAHTDYFVGPHESNDWIELFNAGASTVILNGDWYLSDDIDDLKKYQLSTAAVSSGAYISYDQVNHFNPDGMGPEGWGLNKAGDDIFLSYLPGVVGYDRIVDCIRFKGQENSISLSRYPDGGTYWLPTYPDTRDGANANATDHVVISEMMYHPTDGTTNDEYIELYNATGASVNLWTVAGPWALDGGVNYTFPASVTLANGQKILVVDFDPALETARLDVFESTYGTGDLTAGVDIFGPWSGSLSNNGERVTLEKPQDSDDPLDPLAISWIIVDECVYNDYWPWPTEPDGTGDALLRSNPSDPTVSGNDPAGWQNAAPTPGS